MERATTGDSVLALFQKIREYKIKLRAPCFFIALTTRLIQYDTLDRPLALEDFYPWLLV